MIRYQTGDLLTDAAEALVNTVNCVGFMGRGIALRFKKAWPDNFRAYAAACKRKEVTPGRMFVYETGQLGNPRYIVNFPTKRHWKGGSRLEDIKTGLAALALEIGQRGIRSIAVPPLAAGLGGLDWNDVRPLIDAALGALPGVEVIVYEPSEAPAAIPAHDRTAAPAMTQGRAALVGLMHRCLGGLLDTTISLLEVHKLMYFMQEAGEPLRLKIAKAAFGPYAENLRHVLHEIEGTYVAGYGDGGDAPDKALELVPGAVEEAHAFLDRHPETKERFERVAALVAGFESPFGLELLATVHWVAQREAARTAADIIAKTYAWNDRKQRFSKGQILLAHDVLTRQAWLEPAAE